MKEWKIVVRVLNAPDDFDGHSWSSRILQQLDDEHIMASAQSYEVGPADPAVFADPAWNSKEAT